MSNIIPILSGGGIKLLDTFKPFAQNKQINNGQTGKIEVNDTGIFYYEQNNVVSKITVNDVSGSFYKTVDYQGIKAADGITINTANLAPTFYIIADGEKIGFICNDRGGFSTPIILETTARKLESLTIQANQNIVYASLTKIANVG